MRHFIILIAIFQDLELINLFADASFSNFVKITRPPENHFPKSGNLRLICLAEGNPMPTVVWYNARTNHPVFFDHSIDLKTYSNEGLLIINNPKSYKTYEFYCNASNDKQWVTSKPAKTGLSYLSQTFRMQPENIQIFKEFQTAILSCQLPNGNPPPKSKWYKDQRELLKYSILEDPQRLSFSNNENGNCSLKIRSLKLTDSGEYHCVANNEHQTIESQTSWLLVMNSFSDLIFDMAVKQLSHKIGDNIEMICQSNYKESIKWIFSKELSDKNHKPLYSNKIYKKNIKLEDRGIYACLSNTSNARLLNIFNLTIVPVELNEEKIKILKKVVIEGANVMLECDLENSKAEYYWETPQSPPIFPNDYTHPRFRVSKDGFLNILNAQPTDTGKYTCNVHTSLDVKHKSVWLEVSKMQLDIYPVISLPAQNLTVLQGSDINLKCEVIGEDIIKLIWYVGMNIKERLIKDWQISFPTKESLLIINSQTKTHTNFYTCEAINEQGLKASWTAYVNVVNNVRDIQPINLSELPLPPVVELPKNIKSNSLELVWSSNNNPNLKILYWIEFVHFGSKNGWEIYKRNWPHHFITIENLKPDTWYQFLVRSKTDIGIGRASVPTEYVKTKNFMSDEPYSGNVGFQFTKIKLIEPEIINGRRIQLKWNLNKEEDDNEFRSTFYTQFYLNFRSLPIVSCIVDKLNGNPYESPLVPVNNNYCSLKSMNSELLKQLKSNFSPNDEKKFQIPIDFQRINISKSNNFPKNIYAQVSWFIPNVTFFNCYNFSISSRSEYKSVTSNSKFILIPESKPSKAPSNIHISWILPEVSINIKWEMPDRQFWNGVITGSNIYMKSNESEIVLKFNDTISSKTISQVNPNINWFVQISIINCMGESEKSQPVLLHKLSDALLMKSESLIISNSEKINLFKKSWMIATLVVTSVLIWLMLSFLTIYLCCNKSFRFTSQKFFNIKTYESNDTPVNKEVKDGLINNQINEMSEKDNQFNDNDNDKCVKINNISLSPISSNLFCNPYASTQIFEPSVDNCIGEKTIDFVRYNWAEPENMNLYYLSSPIFDSSTGNEISHNSLNFYLPSNQECIDHQNIHNSISNKNHLIPFSIYRAPEDSKNSQSDLHFENRSSPRKEQAVELSVLKNNGTISNLLISTAPFSDQFTGSSKSKSTNNSSNSDSSHQQVTNEHVPRLKKSNVQSKTNKRRHDPGDFFDQSTEMTHLLANLPDKRSPFSTRDSNRVYDIPYSDTVSIIDKDN